MLCYRRSKMIFPQVVRELHEGRTTCLTRWTYSTRKDGNSSNRRVSMRADPQEPMQTKQMQTKRKAGKSLPHFKTRVCVIIYLFSHYGIVNQALEGGLPHQFQPFFSVITYRTRHFCSETETLWEQVHTLVIWLNMRIRCPPALSLGSIRSRSSNLPELRMRSYGTTREKGCSRDAKGDGDELESASR